MDQAIIPRLALADEKIVVIGERDLLCYDSSSRKSQRSRCLPLNLDTPAKQCIPLYNILWAAISADKLLIDYALPSSKSSLRHETLALTLSTSSIATTSRHLSPEVFTATLLSRAYGEAQVCKKALVLINPHSGPGNAVRKWNNEVKPLLEAARTVLDVVTLQRGGEAEELAKHVDIEKYDTIIACSGDGTPHEIFNGLAKRPDAQRALHSIAVSHIPCGSGNAMACNLSGSHRASIAALTIIKGIVTPLDLVSITQGKRRVISFLSQALGIIAESDLATEHLRWMGSARFDVGVLMRVFRQRCYPFDLAVKVECEKDEVKAHYKRHVSGATSNMDNSRRQEQSLESEALPPLRYGTIGDDLPNGWELISYNNIGNFYCGNMAFMAPDINFFPAALASDGCMDLVMINGDLPPITAAKTLVAAESTKFFDNPHVSYKKISAYRIIPRDQIHGFISIDGERIPFEPFQAEVHQGLGRVLSKRGRLEALGLLN